MSRKGRRRSNRFFLWLGVCLLTTGVGFLGGYLFHELPGHPPASDQAGGRAVLEDLLGPLRGELVRLRVASAQEARDLAAELTAAADRFRGEVELSGWVETATSLLGELTVGGESSAVQLEWPRPADRQGPLLAVVIDDMGQNADLDRALLELPIPITPSLLPHLTHTRSLALLAKERGREVLLHLPMEPQEYPRHDPGPGAILEAMGEQEVRRRVRESLEAVPGAMGVNNHMGSRLTEVPRTMGWVLDEIRRQGLFFLDSVTTAHTVGADLAREMRIPWLRRDVFLDNERTPAAIGRQLERALRIARDRGYAVAIGHPHRVTLETLRSWGPRIREAGVEVVPVSRLVHQPEGV